MMSWKIFPVPAPPSDSGKPAKVLGEDGARPGAIDPAAVAAIDPAAVAAMHKRRNGDVTVIQPPTPGIRAVIDRMAGHAAKHGPEFEKRILADVFGQKTVRKFESPPSFFYSFFVSKKKKGAFDFMMLSNPYNAYYHQKVAELRDQLSGKERFAA